MGFDQNMDFVVIKPSDLLAKLDTIHGKAKTIQSYLWVTEAKRCWEARGLNHQDQTRIAQDEYTNDVRDFSSPDFSSVRPTCTWRCSESKNWER